MKLKELQDAMIAAMKAKDKFRKDAIADLVSAVKKKGIDAGCNRGNLKGDKNSKGADRHLPCRQNRASRRLQEEV